MLILPDIHGRTFWRKPVEETLGKEHIIFLGDYVDPYSYEGIAPWDAYARFEEIVELKKAHPDDITLLLGNHDLHYLSMLLISGRYDIERADKIKKLILDNSALFQITHIAETGGRKFLFSHAGIRLQWLEQYKEFLEAEGVRATAMTLNIMWEEARYRQMLYAVLSDVPYCRMGNKPVGSPVWNDVDDMADDPDEFPGWYQVFGHTQQELDPVIGKHFACLDCRRPFRLTEDGEIKPYEDNSLAGGKEEFYARIDEVRKDIVDKEDFFACVDEARKGKEITPTHPGEVIKDELKARGITQRDFAKMIGVPYTTLNSILNERRPLSASVASNTETALGISADLLMGLQSEYE